MFHEVFGHFRWNYKTRSYLSLMPHGLTVSLVEYLIHVYHRKHVIQRKDSS